MLFSTRPLLWYFSCRSSSSYDDILPRVARSCETPGVQVRQRGYRITQSVDRQLSRATVVGVAWHAQLRSCPEQRLDPASLDIMRWARVCYSAPVLTL